MGGGYKQWEEGECSREGGLVGGWGRRRVGQWEESWAVGGELCSGRRVRQWVLL